MVKGARTSTPCSGLRDLSPRQTLKPVFQSPGLMSFHPTVHTMGSVMGGYGDICCTSRLGVLLQRGVVVAESLVSLLHTCGSIIWTTSN